MNDFDTHIHADEFDDPSEGFNWDEYYTDGPDEVSDEYDEGDEFEGLDEMLAEIEDMIAALNNETEND